MTAAARKITPATYEDLLRLPPGVAAEIIDGEIVEKAMPSADHAQAQAGLGGLLFDPFNRRPGGRPPGGWWILTEADVRYEEGQVFRHDIAGWRRESMADLPRTRPITVRPDWVAEVLSPSNAGNDLIKKLRVLQRHEVPHYWIVDPEHRTLTVMRWTKDGYLNALIAGEGEKVRAEPFDAIELDVGRLFGNEPLE